MPRRLPPLVLLAIFALPLVPAAGANSVTRDLCVDPGAIHGDPRTLIVPDGDCTFRAKVSVTPTNRGFTVEILVETAKGGVHLVFECFDPRYAPVAPLPDTHAEKPYCGLTQGMA